MALRQVAGFTDNSFALSSFALNFDAVPGQNLQDLVIGLSQGSADSYSDLAAAIRFNPNGQIDARNGASYAAAAKVSYSAGQSYHVRMLIDVTAHTYSVFVTPKGQAEVLLAQNYVFRKEQASVNTLDNIGMYGDPGTAAVSNISISITLPSMGSVATTTPAPAPAPAPTTTTAPAPVGDGSNAASACAIQKPTLLSGYAKRPAWKVAGVDYCVGYPSGLTLKSPTSIAISGISVDSANKVVHLKGSGVELNGYDLSNWWVYFEGANQRVVNSKFYNSGLVALTTASNVYVGYSVIDGANATSALIEMRGSGTMTVEYNWLKNSGGDIMQMHTGGRAANLIARYNLIENGGQASGAHGDWTEFMDGPYQTTIMYNTATQRGGACQGFMVEPDIGSSPGVVTSGEIANNVMMGSVNAFTAVTVPDVVNFFKVHDNYYDESQSSLGLSFYSNIRGGPGDSSAKTSWTNNVNMVSGAIQVGP
jgi:hypothetical protein